jgi:hypothetical protein
MGVSACRRVGVSTFSAFSAFSTFSAFSAYR